MKWISIIDRLPKVWEDVLIYPPVYFDGRLSLHSGRLNEHEGSLWWSVSGNGTVYNHNPTHWMELPDPPEKTE